MGFNRESFFVKGLTRYFGYTVHYSLIMEGWKVRLNKQNEWKIAMCFLAPIEVVLTESPFQIYKMEVASPKIELPIVRLYYR